MSPRKRVLVPPAERRPKPKIRKPATDVLKAIGARHELFIETYLVNGGNATKAAIAAGYAAKGASRTGWRLLRTPEIAKRCTVRAEKALFDAGLTTERWAKEMACIAHFDPGELYDAAGNVIPVHLLPEHVRRAIASVEIETTGKRVLTTTTKIKPCDKNTALANVGRNLGAFEEDNRQNAREPIHVTITLVGKINGPERRAGATREAAVLDGDAQLQGRLGRP